MSPLSVANTLRARYEVLLLSAATLDQWKALDADVDRAWHERQGVVVELQQRLRRDRHSIVRDPAHSEVRAAAEVAFEDLQSISLIRRAIRIVIEEWSDPEVRAAQRTVSGD